MTPRLASMLMLLVPLSAVGADPKLPPGVPATNSSGNTRPLRFSSPIQSYTVFDRPAPSAAGRAGPRGRFLPRLRAGLVSERRAGEVMADEQRMGIAGLDEEECDEGGGWAEASAAADERREKAAERRLEAAYDAGVRRYDERAAAKEKDASVVAAASDNKYQFVGVVNNGKDKSKEGVVWYARRKPRGSRWNVRLVHVNRDAVLRDLFVKGKVDLYGKYFNEGLDEAAFAAAGRSDDNSGDGGEAERSGLKPLIIGEYEVRERSWRTLWNFSPSRLFSTPSGSFWRERRIGPGLYTDGTMVFESVYRFRDGKNGMKPVAKLGDFLASRGTVGYEEKMRVVERLKGGDPPDLVVEK